MILWLVIATLGCGKTCGDGTHDEGGVCVADTGDVGSDADTDADADTDTDADSDADSDTDTDTDTDTDADTDGDSDADTDSDTDADTDVPDVDADGDGYRPSDGDCDDADAAVHPGAAEVCRDFLDNDCDGSPGACAWADDTTADDGAIVLKGSRATDLTGWDLGGGDLDGDGVSDIAIGAPYSDEEAADGGVVWIVAGPITKDLSLDTSATASIASDADGDLAGWATQIVPDMNGDGRAELLVGAPGLGNHEPGSLGLFYGPVTGSVRLSDADATWTASATKTSFATTLGGGVDLTGDGAPDFWAGAPYGDDPAQDAGFVAIYDGAAIAGGDAEDDATALRYGKGYNEYAGQGLAAGDTDGDGVGDLLMNVASTTGPVLGVGVHLGPVTGKDYAYGGSDAILDASKTLDVDYQYGHGLSVGDLDLDGYDDALVGADVRDAGRVYLAHGPFASKVTLSTGADIVNGPKGGMSKFGYDVAFVGDVTQDGQPDFLVSERNGAGTVWLVGGDVSGTNDIDDVRIVSWSSPEGSDEMWTARGVGDVNGDGFPDLAFGANYADGDLPTSGLVFLQLSNGF